MKKLVAMMVMAGSMASAAPAFAADDGSTVRYSGKNKVTLTWTAMGCAGVKNGHGFACESATLDASKTKATYKFRWGTTRRELRVSCADGTSYRVKTNNSDTLSLVDTHKYKIGKKVYGSDTGCAKK